MTPTMFQCDIVKNEGPTSSVTNDITVSSHTGMKVNGIYVLYADMLDMGHSDMWPVLE